MISITIPNRAATVLRVLHEAGYEAYAVGGCVRDSILGRRPNDWDITTNAMPRQIKALFRRTVDTGIEHGTVTVMIGPESFEVTTYRIDGDYSDSRYPDSVSFTTSLAEDLRRRDFTVNAMAYEPHGGLVDLFGGVKDLRDGVIRAVGEPAERFDEDALRIMRAVRFSAQLGFSIEEKTAAALHRFAPKLEFISRERIRDELCKLLVSPHPEYFLRLSEAGITAVIMPVFDRMLETEQHTPFHLYDVGHHTLKVMESVENDLVLRLCALLHDVGKVEAKKTDAAGRDHFKGHPAISARFAESFLREYRFDNETIRKVVRLIEVHDMRFPPSLPNVRRMLSRLGPELFPLYLKLIKADNAGQSAYAAEEFMQRYPGMLAAYDEIRAAGDPLSLKDLAVSGNDLIAAGLKPGKELGALLAAMLEDVLETPSHNQKDYLLEHYLPKQ